MPEKIERFFRHCPACGRRFEIHLVGKNLEEENTTEAKIMPSTLSPESGGIRPSFYTASQPGGFRVLQDSSPTIIDVRVFDYTYKCGHCGHTWTELKFER